VRTECGCPAGHRDGDHARFPIEHLHEVTRGALSTTWLPRWAFLGQDTIFGRYAEPSLITLRGKYPGPRRQEYRLGPERFGWDYRPRLQRLFRVTQELLPTPARVARVWVHGIEVTPPPVLYSVYEEVPRVAPLKPCRKPWRAFANRPGEPSVREQMKEIELDVVGKVLVPVGWRARDYLWNAVDYLPPRI